MVEASVLKRKGARTDRHVHERTVQRKWWWKSFRAKGRKVSGAVRHALGAPTGQEKGRATSEAL